MGVEIEGRVNGVQDYEVVWSKEKQKYVKRLTRRKGTERLAGIEEPREVTESMLKPFIFSSYFRLVDFDIKTLNKELPLSRKNRDIAVDVYIDFMDSYLNRLRHGRLPDKSYYLSAPDGFGKKIFAYQVIKEALAHKMKPTPIIPSHDLYTLLETKKYPEFYAYFKEVDLAIITFGGAPSQSDLVVAKTALEHCERYDIPLLILSRFEPEVFYKFDAVATFYLGVQVAKKGNFGASELKGFNKEKMIEIRQQFYSQDGNISGDARNFREQKTSQRRERRD